jgi:hypothetical protein
MPYRTPQPPIESFADPEQQSVVRRMTERLDNLETVTQAQSWDATGRLAPAPAKAALNVSTNSKVKGHVYVRITNPEFLGGKENQAGAPIRHQVQASPSKTFNSNITDFGVTHQTYFDISELGSGTYYFQHRSTYDGKTFNNWSAPQKVVIP